MAADTSVSFDRRQMGDKAVAEVGIMLRLGSLWTRAFGLYTQMFIFSFIPFPIMHNISLIFPIDTGVNSWVWILKNIIREDKIYAQLHFWA